MSHCFSQDNSELSVLDASLERAQNSCKYKVNADQIMLSAKSEHDSLLGGGQDPPNPNAESISSQLDTPVDTLRMRASHFCAPEDGMSP